MTRMNFSHSPYGNPCAQCGKPIATPEWIEQSDSHHVTYLWHCWACDYRFEAVAYFHDDPPSDPEALAA
jgi:hypothetical protein